MNKKRIILSLIFTAAAFAAVFFDVYGAAGSFAEDILYHHPYGAWEKIKIIKIDEKTMNEIGDYSKWKRDVYADLVNTLCVSEDIRPLIIGFDVIFSDTDGGEQDREFADACRDFGNAVTAFSYVFKKDVSYTDKGTVSVLRAEDKSMPYAELADVTAHGFANAITSSKDGIIRKAFLKIEDEYSLSAEIYRRYAELNGISPVFPETDSSGAFYFRYSSAPSDFENISLCDVLDGTVPPEAFDDCIVLVGAYAAGMMDSFGVPSNRGTQMYGVEIHANIIQALEEHKYLRHIPRAADAVICALLSGIIVYMCFSVSLAKTATVCTAAAFGKLAVGFVLWECGLASDVLVFPTMCLMTAGFYNAVHYYTATRAKKELETAFKKYVAPQVVDEIAKSGNYKLALGGEKRHIAVLFVDIRGFTTLSEKLNPEQIVDILNVYLDLVTNCVFRYGGTLDKFVGDAAMAVYNSPFDTEDYILKAVLSAMDIIRGQEPIDKMFKEKYDCTVGFGVGVNCGEAVVGNIGSRYRMDYTAIGDTVNTAARLEANAPGGTVYISDSVYESLKDILTVDKVGNIPLKGKAEDVCVYSVTDIKNEKIKPDGRYITEIEKNNL